MTQPLVILDPAHGGQSSRFYDLENGVQLPFTHEEVQGFRSGQKRYLSQDAYLRWKRGERAEEPRFYFEHKGRKVTYGDPGDRSPMAPDFREKDLVLDVARTLARLLEGRCVVKLTRDRDGYVALPSRVSYANRTYRKYARPAVMMSLHADASEDPDESGFVVYRRPHRDALLAECLQRALARHVAELGCGPGRREIREEGQPLLIQTDLPAVTIQLGYLSHPEDAERLVDRRLREELARSLAHGVGSYFQHVEAGTRPRAAATIEASSSAESSSAEQYGEVQA